MKHLIDKSAVAAEIKHHLQFTSEHTNAFIEGEEHAYRTILSFLDTLKVKEVDLTDRKTEWCPSNKQMESLHDLLKYNIGVFDYQKFMEVKSLYDSLTKISDYEIDRQK